MHGILKDEIERYRSMGVGYPLSAVPDIEVGQVVEQIGPSEMNRIGLEALNYKLIVEIDDVAERTAGGLYLPDTTREKEKMAAERGTVVSIGGNAFEDFKGAVPKLGDRVIFGKYAGAVIKIKGKDKDYRVLNDKDLHCIDRNEG